MDKQYIFIKQILQIMPKNEMYRRGFLQALCSADQITNQQWVEYSREFTPKYYYRTLKSRPWVFASHHIHRKENSDEQTTG